MALEEVLAVNTGLEFLIWLSRLCSLSQVRSRACNDNVNALEQLMRRTHACGPQESRTEESERVSWHQIRFQVALSARYQHAFVKSGIATS